MGEIPRFRSAIFVSSLSTQVTSMPKSARHAPVTSPTYPVPTMQMFMRESPPEVVRNRRSLADLRASPTEQVEELAPGDRPRRGGSLGIRDACHGRDGLRSAEA